jgi:hypothetical protein
MEWRLENRDSPRDDWHKSNFSVPLDYDEQKVKETLKYLRTEYPSYEFRVLKVMWY